MKRMTSFISVVVLLCVMTALPTAAAASNEALLSHIGGDVNGDWTLTTSDARIIFSVVSGRDDTDTVAKRGDIDDNGTINMLDVMHVLHTCVYSEPTVLVKPPVTVLQTAPEGEEVAFTVANEYMQYADDSRRQEDVWVAQSLDELKAGFAHSNGKVDYSEDYTEAFFEDRAVIVWASHFVDDGLVDMSFGGIVKNGNELCLVRNARYFSIMPMDYFERYVLEIDKDDLEGVDIICTYTKRIDL